MVRVDETGDDSTVRGVDGLIWLEIRGDGRGHGADLMVLDQHMVVLQLLDAVAGIPTDDVAIFNEQLHAPAIFLRGKRRRTQRNSTKITGAAGRLIGTAFWLCRIALDNAGQFVL